jgi:hypothetical protein
MTSASLEFSFDAVRQPTNARAEIIRRKEETATRFKALSDILSPP